MVLYKIRNAAPDGIFFVSSVAASMLSVKRRPTQTLVKWQPAVEFAKLADCIGVRLSLAHKPFVRPGRKPREPLRAQEVGPLFHFTEQEMLTHIAAFFAGDQVAVVDQVAFLLVVYKESQISSLEIMNFGRSQTLILNLECFHGFELNVN